jgi:hypothetical protein
MDQLTPTLALLVERFHPCFRKEVFAMFQATVGAWIVCLGRRTISRVWESTGRSKDHDHSAAFRFFSQAAWNWDELCRILLLMIVTRFVPGMRIWIGVDDTLAHKRGIKVAFGGIFLDAVLSTKRHKVFRYGNNWVKLAVLIQLPFRQDRWYALPILWRVYAKKSAASSERPHRTRSQLAAEMIRCIAGWLPSRKFLVLGDDAYIGGPLLKGRPENVEVLGPIRWNAALNALPEPGDKRRKKGERLMTPKEILDDDTAWPVQTIVVELPKGSRELEVKVMDEVLWYHAAGAAPVQVVLVRDPQGEWRNEALVCTDLSLSAAEIVAGYCRRWAVEVSFFDAKQYLGFHDPQVWCERSVERAAPMSWFVSSLVVLWYADYGRYQEMARRHRPWYRHKVEPTFADMLATCRLDLWEHWLEGQSGPSEELDEKLYWLLEYMATAA